MGEKGCRLQLHKDRQTFAKKGPSAYTLLQRNITKILLLLFVAMLWDVLFLPRYFLLGLEKSRVRKRFSYRVYDQDNTKG